MESKIKKVLVVSLRAGAGHVKAAEALAQAIKKNKKDIIVENIDFLDYSNILSKKFYSQLYIDVVKYTPDFYAWLYKNVKPASTSFRLIFDRINAQEFKKKVFDFSPDLIICTHFVAANLLTYWREKNGLKYKVWLVVTDFEAHKLWLDKRVDAYFVAIDLVKKQLVKWGINEKIIHVTGIPINEKFTKNYNKTEIKKKLGLENIFTIAVFSGGFGMGPVEKIIKSILKMTDKFQLIITVGKNKELFGRVKKAAKSSDKKVFIYGFINNMEEMMVAADIIVSKPGGLTVSESMAMGSPLLVSNPIPGQEEANSRYLLEHKAGMRADTPKEITRALGAILKNKEILLKLSSNMKKIAKPEAADKIIEFIK